MLQVPYRCMQSMHAWGLQSCMPGALAGRWGRLQQGLAEIGACMHQGLEDI